tara:strand:- start:78 stop:503 length:426 start_codon:yes stop_codon:yes gene_type:complete
MGYHVGYIECEVTGITAPPDDGEDIGQEDEAFRLPPGWAAVVVMRRIENPDFKAAVEERKASIDQQVQSAMQAAEGQIEDADKMQFINMLHAQADAQTPLVDVPPYTVAESVFHYSPKYADSVIDSLPGMDEDDANAQATA